jgi:hypothetical protein
MCCSCGNNFHAVLCGVELLWYVCFQLAQGLAHMFKGNHVEAEEMLQLAARWPQDASTMVTCSSSFLCIIFANIAFCHIYIFTSSLLTPGCAQLISMMNLGYIHSVQCGWTPPLVPTMQSKENLSNSRHDIFVRGCIEEALAHWQVVTLPGRTLFTLQTPTSSCYCTIPLYYAIMQY